jgi:3-hydroxyisobutyrate dehydrogenase-like beta-hydroxyacid dehydrogenase
MLVQEGLVLGAKAGLDPLQLNEALRNGTARPYSGLLATLLERDFDSPTFTLGLATKDVGLCLESARDLGVPMPVAAAAHQVYLHALAAGFADRSFAATFEAIEEAARVTVPKVDIRKAGE